MALGDLESRRLGLAHLGMDTLVLGFESRIVRGLGAHHRSVALILAGVGGDIGQDAQLGDIGVVFGADAFQFRMQGLVAGAGQAGIAFIDLGVGIAG